MPLRLSELLERIRPAGAPGAPTEGEEQREHFDRNQEIADIAAALDEFEAEAGLLVAAASAAATELGRNAERRAREIRATVPDRVATVQATAAQNHERRDQAEQSQVADQTRTEIARLETQAAALIPPLVATATDTIWAIVDFDAPPEDRR